MMLEPSLTVGLLPRFGESATKGAPAERRPYEFVCLLGLGFCICVGLVAVRIHIRIRVCSNLELVLYAFNAFDGFGDLVSLSHLGLTCDGAGKRDDTVVDVNIDR